LRWISVNRPRVPRSGLIRASNFRPDLTAH
jgi:hypothetical protein